MNFGFVDPWHQFLPRDPGHVIALMGSGGKTSLMRVLAEVYREISLPVVLTTTTRSEALPGIKDIALSDLSNFEPGELPEVFFLHRGLREDGKWAGLAPASVDDLGGALPDRIIIVEVDGAAKFPVKFYREGEPVWPGRTSLGIVVMGTSAVGSKTEDVLHRFGRLEYAPLGELKPWSVWEWDHSLTLLVEPGGYLSRVPEGIPCILALTGMGEQPDSVGLFDFVGRAMEQDRLPLTMFCDLAADPAVIRTSYIDRDGEP